MGAREVVAWTLFVAAAAAAAALWTTRGSAPQPIVRPAPAPAETPLVESQPDKQESPAVEPATTAPREVTPTPTERDRDAATILRARCVLPPGHVAEYASAWFSVGPEDPNRNYPATLVDDVVTVQVPTGRGELSILVDGCVIERFDVDAPDGATTEIGPFTFRRAIPLRGRVVDEQGEPVTDAFVYPAVGEHSVALHGTDDEGRFEFDGLPAGEAQLRVECDSMVRRIVTFTHTSEAEPIEIVLVQGELLRGRVFDEHGEPIDVVYATVIDTAAPEDRGRMAFPHMADDGTFDVRVPPGRYIVRARNDGRVASETVDVVAGREAFVTLRFAER